MLNHSTGGLGYILFITEVAHHTHTWTLERICLFPPLVQCLQESTPGLGRGGGGTEGQCSVWRTPTQIPCFQSPHKRPEDKQDKKTQCLLYMVEYE